MPAIMQGTATGHAQVIAPMVSRVMAKTDTAATSFGAWLKAVALANGYSQAELGRAANVNQTQLSRAFDDLTVPNVETMRKLAAVLHVRLGDMLIKAGVATASELGTVGATPPPLPAVVRDILSRLGQQSELTDRQKRALLLHLGRALALYDEMLDELNAAPQEPRMRRR